MKITTDLDKKIALLTFFSPFVLSLGWCQTEGGIWLSFLIYVALVIYAGMFFFNRNIIK